MFAPFVFQIAADAQHHIVEYLDGVQAQVAELKRLQAESAEMERLSGAVLARIRAAREARATGEKKRKTQQMRLPTM